uniref:Col_cuticle_N domain-containing protein n=1 Tax=Ascaris lumbricoides TaxID=6252 RepID=A0A0M3HLG2_ASCLU
MRVSVNTVIAFLLSVVFLTYIPGFYIYLYFMNIAFQSFKEPFDFGTLFVELIKVFLFTI